jgi:hypothetical protein
MNAVATDGIGAGVAELQGLYGPYTFSEKLLQKIWLRGEFDRSRAATVDGRRVQVVHPGRWNLLGGPDFKGARLRFGDEREVIGDVELHLAAPDWDAHGHARDPAYDGVVLHVVLFPPEPGHVTVGARGAIPVLPLLPILLHDLEEYATEEAVEALAHRPASEIMERLGRLPRSELAALLQKHSEARWQQKVHFARLRIQRLGWDEAGHHTALEILGYRFNRATMLRVAARRPLPEWANPALDPDAVYADEGGGWSLQGLRPANHPRHRLHQYAAWVRNVPDWPGELERAVRRLPPIEPASPTGVVRCAHGFTRLRAEWEQGICGGAVGGTRFDTLVCDGFLPLLATAGAPVHGLWRHWFVGDLPPVFTRALRELGAFTGRLDPACHGVAQGLLGWLLEQERVEGGATGRGA